MYKQNNKNGEAAGEYVGTEYSNLTISETTYGMEKFHARQGHGYAAERAEHLNDYLDRKDVKILGDDNSLNGADRIVDGKLIQSKYCSSGSVCVAECFRDGNFRYYTKSGKPMQIEVPLDMYEDAVESMQSRIRNGEVSGVKNPDEAKNIIRKGTYTYGQAKAIAKAGTIESIRFDALNGTIIAVNTIGLSAILSFATAIWNGDSINIAVKRGVISGIKVSGVSFLTTVLASQAARAGITAELSGGTDFIAKQMGPKVSAYLANGLKTGENIYGAAAMNNVSKLLRNNIITGVFTVLILSAVDVVNMFQGKMSGRQLMKNVTTTAGTIASGTAGWAGGATVGAAAGSIVPLVGTTAGAFLGAIVGAFSAGTAGNRVTRAVMDVMIEDDAKKMLRIFEMELQKVLEKEYLIVYEAEQLMESIKDDIDYDSLKDMYASGNYEKWAHDFIQERIDTILSCREYIGIPSEQEWMEGIRDILEDVIDGKDIGGKLLASQDILGKKQCEVLQKYHINSQQIENIMRPVRKMNCVQQRMERTLVDTQQSERHFKRTKEEISMERKNLKCEIEDLLTR